MPSTCRLIQNINNALFSATPTTCFHSTMVTQTLRASLISASESRVPNASVTQFSQSQHHPRFPSSVAELNHRDCRDNSNPDSLYPLLRMCWYKRVIFAENHSKIAGLVRKCHLQLAHENGETSSSCGRVDFHPVQSIKVPEVCPDCATRLDKQADMLAIIKEQLAEAKTKLQLGMDNSSGAEMEESDAPDGNEAFSPLSISY